MKIVGRVIARWKSGALQNAPPPGWGYISKPPTPAQANCRHPKTYRGRDGTECSICGSKKIGNRWMYLDERAFHYYTSGKYASVIPFKGRPQGPTALIGSRKYALSNYWPMGTIGDDESPIEGARVIDTGSKGRFSYLWVYNTDRQILAMWRYSDGDEKHYENAHRAARHIYQLEKRGQLNRATNAEFSVVEREMTQRHEEAIVALREYARSLGGDWQKRVNEIAQDLFDREYRPRINRALSEVERGVVPFGFKFNEGIPKSREDQLRVHVVTQVMMSFTEREVEDAMRAQGLDPEADGVDNQASQWAVNDVRDDAYTEYLR